MPVPLVAPSAVRVARATGPPGGAGLRQGGRALGAPVVPGASRVRTAAAAASPRLTTVEVGTKGPAAPAAAGRAAGPVVPHGVGVACGASVRAPEAATVSRDDGDRTGPLRPTLGAEMPPVATMKTAGRALIVTLPGPLALAGTAVLLVT